MKKRILMSVAASMRQVLSAQSQVAEMAVQRLDRQFQVQLSVAAVSLADSGAFPASIEGPLDALAASLLSGAPSPPPQRSAADGHGGPRPRKRQALLRV